jgi:hypothetical protein
MFITQLFTRGRPQINNYKSCNNSVGQTKQNSNFNYKNGLVPARSVRAISAIAAIPAVLAAIFANIELCVFHYLRAVKIQFQSFP